MSHDQTNVMAEEPSIHAEAFEKNIEAMRSKEEQPEQRPPAIPIEAMPASSEPPTARNDAEDAMDDKDGFINGLLEQQRPPAKGNSKETQSEMIVALAKDSMTLFHTPDGEAFASIQVDEHIENVKVRSNEFRQFIGRHFYHQVGKPAGAAAIKDAMGIIEAEANYDGETIPVHIRYAFHEGCIYIDLCDAKWLQICVGRDSWKVIGSEESPVKFFRAQGMLEMPIPIEGGNINMLQRFINVGNESDWVMIVSWIVGSMRPFGPFTLLVLQGEQGTAKSTTARFLRDLIDPSAVPSQSLPKSERDLVIAASKSWVLNFDNLSYMSPTMSDALCRLATGGGFRTRALYTDDSERLFNAVRPMILNGISDLATRHDLADRSLIVQLPVIPKDRRIPEKELAKDWEDNKPMLFGVMCDALSVALAKVDSVEIPYLPRMADFAIWSTAAETAFGWEPNTFINQYESNQRALVEMALEADSVAIAVIRLMVLHREHEWHGTAMDLLRLFSGNQDLIYDKSWPKKPNVLSGRLRRASASLREIGIEIEWTKSGNRYIHIIATPEFNLETRRREIGAPESEQDINDMDLPD